MDEESVSLAAERAATLESTFNETTRLVGFASVTMGDALIAKGRLDITIKQAHQKLHPKAAASYFPVFLTLGQAAEDAAQISSGLSTVTALTRGLEPLDLTLRLDTLALARTQLELLGTLLDSYFTEIRSAQQTLAAAVADRRTTYQTALRYLDQACASGPGVLAAAQALAGLLSRVAADLVPEGAPDR